jgi:uncharacterized sulfatase
LSVTPNNGTTFTHLTFKNSAAAGNEFGKTGLTTASGSIDFNGDLSVKNSLTVTAQGASDSISLDGQIDLAANKGIWLTHSAGTLSLGGTFTGAAGSFIEIGTDATLTSGGFIMNSAARLGLTGSNTKFTLASNNGIQCPLDTLNTSGEPQGDRTLDLTTMGSTNAGTLTLNDGHVLHIDFSDPASNLLSFANSSAMPWATNATLNLLGFDANKDALRFGFNVSGLTTQQLAQITINGLSGDYKLNSEGYLNRPSPTNTVPRKPNIIIIYTDDHGYTDLGIHGIDANLQTPVLDSLAAGGALMRYGYSTAPQCVPSRSGILSGRIQNTFGTRQNGSIGGAIPVPLNVLTIAERLVALGGYRTGMIGKWHLEIPADVPDTNFPGTRADYLPGARGFQEYWYGATSPYDANFNLNGLTLNPAQTITDNRNRVIVQGEAARAFIGRNQSQPFFLYLALFGPHVPLISKTDALYLNYPVLDYPNYGDDLDDIRRRGLALVKAVDDAVGGVMDKLRELGLEEDTLIFFSGDNGAQPKFWNSVGGATTISAWNGSENLPLRGEKGSLWEGGMKVPMFAYWKGHIPGHQLITEPVSTLDFTATILKLAGGTIPPEFDGTDILPRLTGQTNAIARAKPLFWDWGDEIAMHKGDWKIHRIGNHKSLFNLASDPDELYDLKLQLPEKFSAMEAELMAWYNALPPEGQSPLLNGAADLYITGAPTNTPIDPRFIIPYAGGSAAAYPAPLTTVNNPSFDSDADQMSDGDENVAGTDPADAQSFFALEPSPAGKLIFDGQAGRSYTVWATPQLEPAAWGIVTNTGVLATGRVIQIEYPANQISRFYRVQVVKP